MTAPAAVLAAVAGCAVALAGGLALRSSLRRVRSLRRQVLVVTLSSLGAGAAVAAVLARQMVLDPEQFRRVVAVLALTACFATVLVVTATGPLGHDARRLEATVRAIESGDRDVRAGIARADELGHVARALDDAVVRLAALERERDEEEARRTALFSSIGHDLRTPLAALAAAVEAMQDGVAPDPERYLRSMHRDVDALSGLVDDLFLLARLEASDAAVERTRVDLAEIADEAAEALAPVAEARGVRISVAGTGRALVHGSPPALGRIVRNLLDNAIRHSPPGGEVRLAVEAGAGTATVVVLDEGDGFPPGFAGVAFDRFSRADASRSRSTGGAGLGLAIARRLVEAHGGAIWIDDGAHGRVSFAVPAVAAGAAPAG